MNKTLFALFLGLTAISAGKSLIMSLSFKVQMGLRHKMTQGNVREVLIKS